MGARRPREGGFEVACGAQQLARSIADWSAGGMRRLSNWAALAGWLRVSGCDVLVETSTEQCRAHADCDVEGELLGLEENGALALCSATE